MFIGNHSSSGSNGPGRKGRLLSLWDHSWYSRSGDWGRGDRFRGWRGRGWWHHWHDGSGGNVAVIAVSGRAVSCQAGSVGTWIAAYLDRNLTADDAWYAACCRVGHLSGHTPMNAASRRVGDLVASRVRHTASNCFTGVGAGRVRNPTSDAFIDISASRVGNLTGDAFTHHGAGRVGNPASHTFVNIAHAGARNLTASAFTNHCAGGVGHTSCLGHRNAVANRVRNLACLGFANKSGRANLSLFDAWAPDPAAAGRAWALNLNFAAAAWLVAAAAGARVEFPSPWILNTLGHHRTRNVVGLGLPVTRANFHCVGFGDGATDSVANVSIAGFNLVPVRRAADISVAGVVNRTANGVVHSSVRRVVNRAANPLSAFTEARLVDRTANRLCHVTVARLVDRTANVLNTFTIAGLVNRAPNRGANIAIVRFVHRSHTGHRDLFRDMIVYCSAARHVLPVPDDFANRPVTVVMAVYSCLTVIAARCTCCGGTAIEASSSTVARVRGRPHSQRHEQGSKDRDPVRLPH